MSQNILTGFKVVKITHHALFHGEIIRNYWKNMSIYLKNKAKPWNIIFFVQSWQIIYFEDIYKLFLLMRQSFTEFRFKLVLWWQSTGSKVWKKTNFEKKLNCGSFGSNMYIFLCRPQVHCKNIGDFVIIDVIIIPYFMVEVSITIQFLHQTNMWSQVADTHATLL